MYHSEAAALSADLPRLALALPLFLPLPLSLPNPAEHVTVCPLRCAALIHCPIVLKMQHLLAFWGPKANRNAVIGNRLARRFPIIRYARTFCV